MFIIDKWPSVVQFSSTDSLFCASERREFTLIKRTSFVLKHRTGSEMASALPTPSIKFVRSGRNLAHAVRLQIPRQDGLWSIFRSQQAVQTRASQFRP
uniref:Uncharacterized protein n=1 Tax=Agrobacterium tumefaciens TaxID=358 RepID=A0A2Z2PVL7_AGRTU|nr:hypothetical protein [Agrobacterium radiobacter]